MSVAGGLERALFRGRDAGCDIIQIFTAGSRQWKPRELTGGEVDAFHRAREQTIVQPVAAHTNYLINLASPRPEVAERSVRSLEQEMVRASLLGIPYVVLHPGSHLGSGESRGLLRISEGLNRVLKAVGDRGVVLLLETTAGQGTSLGCRLEHLAEIREGVEQSHLMGVCLDTCHVFAAGYDFCTDSAYRRFIESFARTVGLDRLKLFHINDSKTPMGSRVDRHEHIGEGRIGGEALGRFLRDPRFSGHAFVLETPKGKDKKGRDSDMLNLGRLRRLSLTTGRA